MLSIQHPDFKIFVLRLMKKIKIIHILSGLSLSHTQYLSFHVFSFMGSLHFQCHLASSLIKELCQCQLWVDIRLFSAAPFYKNLPNSDWRHQGTIILQKGHSLLQTHLVILSSFLTILVFSKVFWLQSFLLFSLFVILQSKYEFEN